MAPFGLKICLLNTQTEGTAKKKPTVEVEDELPHIDETTVGTLSEQVRMTLLHVP